MDDTHIGSALRGIRVRRGWRQSDLATRAGVSRWQVSEAELGRIEAIGLRPLRRIAKALDANLDLALRWRGSDLDRMLNRRHAALHETVARVLARVGGWEIWPEASFSIYGERGVIDLLAWHQGRRALLVVELKSELVDLNELLGTVDRKRRLAPRVAADRGWMPGTLGTWLAVEDRRANRHRLALHAAVLRAAFPSDGRTMRRWLRDPNQAVNALGFLSVAGPAGVMTRTSGRSRVRLADIPRRPAPLCLRADTADARVARAAPEVPPDKPQRR